MPEDDFRKIASKEHNGYIAAGVDVSRATQFAPATLLQPFSKELADRILSKHRSIDEILNTHLGKPFYSTPGFILYNGDLTQFLDRLSTSKLQVELTLTSPPYNIGKVYEQPMTIDEYIQWCSRWMCQIHNITQTNGAFWLNVGYLEVPEKGLCVPIPYLLWNKSPFYLLQEIVWNYGAGISTKTRLSSRNEKWLFYVKNPGEYTFNLDDIRDPNVKYPNQKKQGKYRCNPLGKNPSDVWEFPKVTTGKNRCSRERTRHPAQFPLGIVERVIRVSSHPTDLVLDPFAGSGSTGIAAFGLGRLFLGFEIKSDYCEMAIERFEQFKTARNNALLKTYVT
jgi:adenine-specific DNA-methyltransferase